MIKILGLVMFLITNIWGDDIPKPKQPEVSVAILQAKVTTQTQEIDALKKQLAEERARREVGWTYLNTCLENQVQSLKQQQEAKKQ
jgi:hypothetical protein